MKQYFACVSIAIAALALGGCETYVLAPPPQSQIVADEDDIAEDEIVVLVGSREAEGSLVKRVRQRGYRVTRRNQLSGLGYYLFAVEPPRGVSRTQAIREIERLEPSATAGVNHRYVIQTSAHTDHSHAFEPAKTIEKGAADARNFAHELMHWPREGCPAAAKVGIIDSPLSSARVASSGVALIEERFTPAPSKPAAPGPTHGDLIAELLVGQGRVKAEALYVAAVAGASGAAPSAGVFELVQALDWMQASNVRVVNVSLAGPYNKILDRAVQRSVGKGMIIVAAAGNDGPLSPPRYPAAFDNVIAVTAVDHRQTIFKDAVRGPHIDFAAPGVDVLVSAGESARYVTGTSIAAPFVSGRIAADDSALQQQSIRGVRAMLAKDARDAGPPGVDAVYGAGLVIAPAFCRD